MIKVAATPADVRKRKIIQAVQDMNFAADPYAQQFGISVDSIMAQVRGKKPFTFLLAPLKIRLYTINFCFF